MRGHRLQKGAHPGDPYQRCDEALTRARILCQLPRNQSDLREHQRSHHKGDLARVDRMPVGQSLRRAMPEARIDHQLHQPDQNDQAEVHEQAQRLKHGVF